MTRIEAIIGEIRKELEKRPALLDMDLAALHVSLYFKGSTEVVLKPEFKSRRVEPRRRGA